LSENLGNSNSHGGIEIKHWYPYNTTLNNKYNQQLGGVYSKDDVEFQIKREHSSIKYLTVSYNMKRIESIDVAYFDNKLNMGIKVIDSYQEGHYHKGNIYPKCHKCIIQYYNKMYELNKCYQRCT